MPPDLKPVVIGGLFPDTVNVIPKTLVSLHLMTGRLEEEGEAEGRQKVLVPFAELRLGGGSIAEMLNDGLIADNADPPTLFATTLSIENTAFVLLDLMSDLRRICVEVTSLAQGELVVEPGRMAHVRYFVAHLERQARLCRRSLDQVYGEPEAVAQE